MTADRSEALVCSGRPDVSAALRRELEDLGAEVDVAESQDEWPARAPGIAFIDLADEDQAVREARIAFGVSTELVAVVDNESVERLIPALAAGCGDYLFYPLNPDELGLKWRRHVAGEGGTRARRPGGLAGRLDLAIPSSVRYVRDTVDEIVDACERLAFSGSRATLNLRVAVGEAITNAILYGNLEDETKQVRVTVDLRPGVARVSVSDEGAGFDPGSVADPTRPENLSRSHGRGLFLLRSLADLVEFNEKGNSVTLTLRDELVAREHVARPTGQLSRLRGESEAHSGREGRAVSERLEEYLVSFHRLTGLRFRLTLDADGVTTVLHDSLGDPREVEYTETGWAVMPETRLRLATAPAAGGDGELLTAMLRESASRLVASEKEARFFAGELSDRYEEIDLLTSAGETLGSIIHLERATGRLLGRLADVLRGDLATVWVSRERAGGLHRVAAGGDGAGTAPLEMEESDRDLVRQVLRTHAAQVRPRRGAGGGEAERAVLAVPLRHSALHGSSLPVGALIVRGKADRASFSQADASLAAAVASHLAAAIENGRLVRESLVQERMVVELELAHHLQMKLLPNLEDFEGVADVAARCEPAESVGGDFYHLFRLPGDRLGVMLGDVSSHGYSAGLIMALTMSAASITVREREEPAEVLRAIHHELVRKLESTEMYMTVCYAVLDPGAERVRYANAGHPHAYHISPDGARRLEALNPPLGIAEFDSYSQREMSWRPGRDMLLMFTDGVSECLETDRLWSDERLTGMAMERAGAGAQEVLDRLFELASAPGGVAADDRTAVVVK